MRFRLIIITNSLSFNSSSSSSSSGSSSSSSSLANSTRTRSFRYSKHHRILIINLSISNRKTHKNLAMPNKMNFYFFQLNRRILNSYQIKKMKSKIRLLQIMDSLDFKNKITILIVWEKFSRQIL